MSSSDNPPQTQATLIYEGIRRGIFSGSLKPGARLRVDKLRQQYDSSGSPVREALNRLSANGLVEKQENRGFCVPEISRGELEEIYKTRGWLEETALRESIRHGDKEWEEQIILALHRLNRTPRQLTENNESNPQWDQLHREFHLSLISGCRSRFLLQYCQQLHDQTDRYRQVAVAIAPLRKSKDEHQEIVDLVINRDADKAVKTLLKHYERTQSIILQGDL